MLIHRLLWLSAVTFGLIFVACGDTSEPTPESAETPAAPSAEATAEPTAIAYITTPCPVTIANGSMPPGETNRTAPVNHGNGEIWIALWTGGKVVFRPGGPGQIFASGAMTMSFPWWSTARGALTIQGRRLDAPSLFPMGPWDKGDIGDDGFFMRTITFPSEGCWEVTGSVGDVSLNFVTLVVREDGPKTPIASLTMPCPVSVPNGKRPPGTPFRPGEPPRYHRSGDMWTSLPSDGKVVFTRDGGAGRILSSGAMWAKWSWWRADGETRLTSGGSLTIEGRRLDASASPLRADIPYYWDGVQLVTALIFPTEGCWEVTGSVGAASLTFVTLVVRAGALTPTTPGADFSDVFLLQQRDDGRGSTIRQVDTYNGADVPGYTPISLVDGGSFGSASISEDGGTLAAIESRGKVCSNYAGGGGCVPRGAALHLIDLNTWSEVAAPLPGTGVVQRVVFSPDAERVALSYLERDSLGRQETTTLMVFDTDTGAAVSRQALGFRPSMLEYSRDGAEMVVYGAAEGPILGISKPGSPRLVLLDANTQEVKWERELANVVSGHWCIENCRESYENKVFTAWGPAVVLSKDRRLLYIVHADDERITTVDLDARSVLEIEIRLARSRAERFLDLAAGVIEAGPADAGVVRTAALSFDETRLFVLTMESEGPRWLTVVDIATGQRTARRETEATAVRVPLDGKFLLLDGGVGSEHRTEVLGADSLEPVANLAEWWVTTGRDLAGRPIVLAQQFKEKSTWFAVLDTETFEIGHGWAVDGLALWIAP